MLFCCSKPYTVSFFGHRYVESFSYLEPKLDKMIEKLLTDKKYVQFLIGRNGEFDQIVSSSIRRAKKRLGDVNCSHILVLPYSSAEFRENIDAFYEYYDDVMIASDFIGRVHPKGALQARNRMMTDLSDLIVVYVNRQTGGAWQTYKYAKQHGKLIINLAFEEASLM